jgi:hypothetical protein
MAGFDDPTDLLSIVSALLMILLNAHNILNVASIPIEASRHEDFIVHMEEGVRHMDNLYSTSIAALYSCQLWNNLLLVDHELGYWVKPRSTTWFSRFVIEEYDDDRWSSLFRMTKASVFELSHQLWPFIQKQNTKYRLTIPVVVHVACTLLKLAHATNTRLCSELFAIGMSTVSNVIHDTCRAINIALRHEIAWPIGNRLLQVQNDFKVLCGLPAVVGAIDGTHIHISKPRVGPEDYYYFKSHGYTLNCQAVVDSRKVFLDLFLGMPGSTNDSRVLRRSSLYQLAMRGELFPPSLGRDGFPPYLLGDSGYPNLPWLVTPHRGNNLTMLEALYNRKLRRGRGVVENAFGILKMTWRELLGKSELNVVYMPDVITACAILHNILRKQANEDLEALGAMVNNGGVEDADDDAYSDNEVCDDEGPQSRITNDGEDLRRCLGSYLGSQRGVPP